MKIKIEQLLKNKLAASIVEVIDDSERHRGHKEAMQSGGGHFSILVVSDQFDGKRLVERHRLVYEVLKDLKRDIHALAIKAYTIKEYALKINY